MATQTQLYLDIPGVGEVATRLSRDRNPFQNQIYAQIEGLAVYGDKGISRVEKFTAPEDLVHHPQNQNGEWIRQQTERLGIPEKDVNDGYRELKNEIATYVVQSGALLFWVPSYLVKGSSISSRGFPIYVSDWKIPEDQSNEEFWAEPNKKQRIVINSFTPVPYWLNEYGKITPDMSELLEASDDTLVWTNRERNYFFGARALRRDFRFPVGPVPVLYSYWGPWDGGSYWGSLLGRNVDESLRICHS